MCYLGMQQDHEGDHQQQDMQQNEEGGFLTDEEIQNLREIFDLFDKEKTGQIELKDLEAVMNTLQKDAGEVKQMIH